MCELLSKVQSTEQYSDGFVLDWFLKVSDNDTPHLNVELEG